MSSEFAILNAHVGSALVALRPERRNRVPVHVAYRSTRSLRASAQPTSNPKQAERARARWPTNGGATSVSSVFAILNAHVGSALVALRLEGALDRTIDLPFSIGRKLNQP